MTLVEARRAAATAIRDNVPAQTDIRVFEVDVISARDLPNLIKEAEGYVASPTPRWERLAPHWLPSWLRGENRPDHKHHRLHADQEPPGAQSGSDRSRPWVGGGRYRGEGPEHSARIRAA